MSSVTYMQRCLQLARLGSQYAMPNPMVGAVLVHEDRIIGEGWHEQYGQAHAEVNCIASVKEEDKHLISQGTLYVSLEPCSHYGKTPPCADLIIEQKIPVVVIGSHDINKQVDGKGVKKLLMAGVNVITGVLEDECIELNKRFFTFHGEHRPYVVLKWAETADGFIASQSAERLLISNPTTNRLVHKWRSEEASILVGTNTALNDDPSLLTMLWDGPSPIRMVVDMNLRLPSTLKIFGPETLTIIFNKIKHQEDGKNLYYQVTEDVSLVHQILNALYQKNVQSVLVEGGAQLLQSFIDEDLWDEARVIKNEKLKIKNGLPAPRLSQASQIEKQSIESDTIEVYKPIKSNSWF